MIFPHRNLSRLRQIIIFAGLLVLWTGCARNKHILELDYHFSMKVLEAPEWYPGENDELGPGQTDIYQRMGSPDYLRFWWRPDGSIITTSDLASRGSEKIMMDMKSCDKSWIFLREGEEVIFYKKGGYKKQPLDESVKLLCTYGDPTLRNPPVIKNGRKMETWIWIDRGIRIVLEDGKEVDRAYTTPTGSGTIISK